MWITGSLLHKNCYVIYLFGCDCPWTSEQAWQHLCQPPAPPSCPPRTASSSPSRAGAETAWGKAWSCTRTAKCRPHTEFPTQPAGLLFVSILYQETKALRGQGRGPVPQSKSAVN